MDRPVYDFTIQNLGPAQIPSPVEQSRRATLYPMHYVSDDQQIIYDIQTSAQNPCNSDPLLIEKAGPRRQIFFDPLKTHAAIVTCGGLCPGLNDVIRAIVMCLWYQYNVNNIFGFQYGYRGFIQRFNIPPIQLTPKIVKDIQHQGGTILGSSRGFGQEVEEITKTLIKHNINLLFTIGGDGTQRGALNISNYVRDQKLPIAVVGVPKTIDNDISFSQRSFGFDTAVSHAVKAIDAAHIEAYNSINGIGIVKVMGRQSGFIAAHAALANNDVNCVLVPEVQFQLEGPYGLLAHIEHRLSQRGHAVIVVAEGAGQDHLDKANTTDASGNITLSDIGPYLVHQFKNYFKQRQIDVNIKYIDPSYIIRAAPANPNDSIYCAQLGTHAAHAAMAGKTSVLLTLMNSQFVHIPISLAVSQRNCIQPQGELWRDVIATTGQPPFNPPD
ncbi:MAG: ATP-dependent 6-phosphofructokinase [Sedimentisphaerales bacterium]|nr:ATP-dependent 6-phosphofructokinase [Sedimentisphaerales bacterium]